MNEERGGDSIRVHNLVHSPQSTSILLHHRHLSPHSSPHHINLISTPYFLYVTLAILLVRRRYVVAIRGEDDASETNYLTHYPYPYSPFTLALGDLGQRLLLSPSASSLPPSPPPPLQQLDSADRSLVWVGQFLFLHLAPFHILFHVLSPFLYQSHYHHRPSHLPHSEPIHRHRFAPVRVLAPVHVHVLFLSPYYHQPPHSAPPHSAPPHSAPIHPRPLPVQPLALYPPVHLYHPVLLDRPVHPGRLLSHFHLQQLRAQPRHPHQHHHPSPRYRQ